MREKYFASSSLLGIKRIIGGTQLLLFPSGEFLDWLGNDCKAHMSVLQSAELGTLPLVCTLFIDFECKSGRISRQKIAFTSHTRRPETVDHVRGTRQNGDRF